MNWKLWLVEILELVPKIVRGIRERRKKKRADMRSLKDQMAANDAKIDAMLNDQRDD